MNILNLPEFEVLRAKVLFGTSATKKPKYKRVEYQAPISKFTWDGYITKTKTIIEEGFGVDIPQLLEVLESNKF